MMSGISKDAVEKYLNSDMEVYLNREKKVYKVHCFSCHWAREFGASKFGAFGAYNRHLIKYPHHDTKVMVSEINWIELLTNANVGQQEIPF